MIECSSGDVVVWVNGLIKILVICGVKRINVVMIIKFSVNFGN